MSRSNDWACFAFDYGAEHEPDEDDQLVYALRGCSAQHLFVYHEGGMVKISDQTGDDLLRFYNWYFHFCRVEGMEGPEDGRPEVDRQMFRQRLSQYFEGELQWPDHIDMFYFDLEVLGTIPVEAAAAEVAPPIEDEWSVEEGWARRHPVDIVRSRREGFEHLADYDYNSTDLTSDEDDRTGYCVLDDWWITSHMDIAFVRRGR